MEPKYLVAIKVAVSLIRWQDEYVLYNQLSGDTHLLDGVSGELIELLLKQAMSRDQLLQNLGLWFEELNADELNTYLDDFIARFTALDLLEIAKQPV
ncbi:MAG: HPr-rel-A system PqqD family peptide chaperone [Methylobacter sp.]|nr:HPr-rel-A system PqqD family peptide chaperone [Methylococcales bacterium]MDD5113480.1 HPr-rel-A system PqqD family peptide chaperone [Methylobacter sp.]